MRRSAIAAVVLSLGAGVVAAAPASAVPGYGTAVLPTATEAWYWTAGCASLGCGIVAPPSDPYPAHTLHVGEDAGQQVEASYLTLNTSALPTNSIVTAATLVLPVATDSSDQAYDVASAQIVACPTTESFGDAEFATTPPPESDCRVEARAIYHSGSNGPLFTVDLGPLVKAARGSLDGLGIALLPDPSQSGTWQVPFNGRGRDVAGQTPITAQVTYKPASGPAVTRNPVVPVSGGAPPPAGTGVSPPSPTPASAPASAPEAGPAGPPPAGNPAATGVTAPVSAATGASAAPAAAPAAAAEAPTGTVIRGGRYGLYWAVPIGLMLLAWLVVRTGGGDIRSYLRPGSLAKRMP